MHFLPYSIPAIFALLAKMAILYVSRRAAVQPVQARIFRAAVALSIVLSLAEMAVLQRVGPRTNYWSGVVYYAVSTLMLPLLVHLAISIGCDKWETRRFLPVYVLLYGVATAISATFIFFTSLFMTGARDLGGYTATAIHGSYYWVYEIFLTLSLLLLLLFPVLGLRPNRPEGKRNQCKLWIAAASPLVVLVGVITYLLHLQIHWFNATVTAPLLIALFLATVGYVIHNTRVIELNFYIPWSKARRDKTGLYRKIEELGREPERVSSVHELITHISATLGCPVALILNDDSVVTDSGRAEHGRRVPTASELREFTQLAVIYESSTLSKTHHELMSRYGIEAVIPFFPYSNAAACWIVCGPPFSQRIYSVLDFRILKTQFEKLSGLLIDQVIARGGTTSTDLHARQDACGVPTNRPRARIEDSAHTHKSLEDRIAEFEANCISAALQRSNGNKSEAARALGLKPNTLHYKLRRLGLAK